MKIVCAVVAKDSPCAAKLTMPVLAIGGEKSFGRIDPVVMRNAASNLTGLAVPLPVMEMKPR